MPSRLLIALASLALLSACSQHREPSTSRGTGHPLVGRIWDVNQQRFVELPELQAAAAKAHYVLLGETHDNPEHHRLQAQLIDAVAGAGRKPLVAFEMLDTPQQAQVEAAPRTPDGFAAAVKWDESGWPKFALYRPVFESLFDADLRILAANLPRDQARASVRGGLAALEPALRARIETMAPYPEPVLAQLRKDMVDSHCGMLPEHMVDPMILAQKAKDAQLSLSLAGANAPDGVVLIAGSGHTRKDLAVPALLETDAPGRTTLSLGMLEVAGDAVKPEAYAAPWGGTLPFDYVLWTVAAQREDPCEKMRQHHKKR